MSDNAFPRSIGYNTLAAGVFIPDIFPTRLLQRYYEESITPNIVNMDYEGEITDMGDRVRIRREPEVTITRYYKGQNLSQQDVIDEESQLLIDHGAYFNIPCDDVDKKQADINWINSLERNAIRQLKRYVDQQVLGNIYADAHADNIMVNRSVTPNNIPELLVDAAVLLDEAFVPEEDRWIVVPYWFKGHLKLNPTFIRADSMGDAESIMRTGAVGMFDRFMVYCSPNLAVVGGWTQIIFGCKTAVTFATQFVKTETLRNQFSFGDLIRGLQVFGWKTNYTKHLGKVGVQKG